MQAFKYQDRAAHIPRGPPREARGKNLKGKNFLYLSPSTYSAPTVNSHGTNPASLFGLFPPTKDVRFCICWIELLQNSRGWVVEQQTCFFVRVWRLEVQDQGVGKFYFSSLISLHMVWLPFSYFLTWSFLSTGTYLVRLPLLIKNTSQILT
jgi:hypothetical protein